MGTYLEYALAQQFNFLIPEMVLIGVACLLFLGGTFKADRNLWAWVSLGGLLAAGLFLGLGSQPRSHADDDAGRAALYGTPLLFDSLTCLVRWLGLGVGALFVLFSWNEVDDRRSSDFFACLMVILSGVGLTAASNDLVTLFLALEMISIPTYILLYLPRFDDDAQEASMKYFLLSIFSSALLLFGFSYLYGLTGSTNLSALHHTLNGQPNVRELPAVASIALIMVVAGLGFRITAAPFHFYAPDVYQGAPTVGAALLSVIPKIVGFVALIRVLGFVLPPGLAARDGLAGMGLSQHVPILFWFLAAITMTLGNWQALLQDNLKRLLAYSSVAHTGYILVALASAPYLNRADGPAGVEAVVFYLVAYAATTTGAFAVLSYLSQSNQKIDTLDDLAGLSRTHPGIALVMALFMFSLIGIPITAGFTGKLFIFFGAMAVPQEHATLFRTLAVIGMLNAAVGGWYYLRVVAIMYLRNSLRPIENRRSTPGLVLLVICAVLTVGLGVPPGAGWLLKQANLAAGAKATHVSAPQP